MPSGKAAPRVPEAGLLMNRFARLEEKVREMQDRVQTLEGEHANIFDVREAFQEDFKLSLWNMNDVISKNGRHSKSRLEAFDAEFLRLDNKFVDVQTAIDELEGVHACIDRRVDGFMQTLADGCNMTKASVMSCKELSSEIEDGFRPLQINMDKLQKQITRMQGEIAALRLEAEHRSSECRAHSVKRPHNLKSRTKLNEDNIKIMGDVQQMRDELSNLAINYAERASSIVLTSPPPAVAQDSTVSVKNAVDVAQQAATIMRTRKRCTSCPPAVAMRVAG